MGVAPVPSVLFAVAIEDVPVVFSDDVVGGKTIRSQNIEHPAHKQYFQVVTCAEFSGIEV